MNEVNISRFLSEAKGSYNMNEVNISRFCEAGSYNSEFQKKGIK